MNMACSVQQPSQCVLPVIAELESPGMCCLWAMATLETWTKAHDRTTGAAPFTDWLCYRGRQTWLYLQGRWVLEAWGPGSGAGGEPGAA